LSQQVLVDLSRWQWALTAGFHIIFPSLTVGISMFLVITYAAFMRTGNEVYLRMFRFWRRIFAIGFGLGVVSGIVLTYEFGLNWGGFARDVGPILGVIIGMEVVTAFFLEAGFLGLLIYGRLHARKRPVPAAGLGEGDLEPLVWLAVRPYARRGARLRGLVRHRRLCLVSREGAVPRRGASRSVDRARRRRRINPTADVFGRRRRRRLRDP
jgi:hypothetical protein